MRTPLLYDVEHVGHLGPLGEVQGQHVPRPVWRGADARNEADELPRPHAPLRQCPAQLPRAAASLRGGVGAPPQRAGRNASRPPSRAAGHPGRRPYLRDAPSRSRTRSSARSTSPPISTASSAMEARFELSTRPENKLGTDEEWDFTEGALRSALERRGIEYTINAGDGAFYGPKIDLHMTDVARPLLADGDDPARLPDAGPLRAHIRGRGQRRAHAVRHPPRALRVPRALHGHPDRALRRRVPGLARSGAGADHPRGGRPPRGGGRARPAARRVPGRGRRLRRDGRQADSQRGGREDPYVVVWGDKESEDAIAVRTHGGDQSTKSLDELVAKLRDEAAVS